MSAFPLSEFLALYGLALFGALAILPYAFSLNRDKIANVKLPTAVLVLLSFVQTAVIMGAATAVGLLAAKPVAMGTPLIKTALAGEPVWDSIFKLLPLSIGLGVLSFVIIAVLERFVFAPHVPEALSSTDRKMAPWKRFLASFYGGINEEILLRLFVVSGLTWLLSRVWHISSGLPTNGAYWIAIFLASVLFGLGHLPATKALTPLTPILIIRAVVLNGVAGIFFGWLYWQYGLESAMIAHFSADILLHLISPFMARGVYKDVQHSTEIPD